MIAQRKRPAIRVGPRLAGFPPDEPAVAVMPEPAPTVAESPVFTMFPVSRPTKTAPRTFDYFPEILEITRGQLIDLLDVGVAIGTQAT
jgi:hypothetical protein